MAMRSSRSSEKVLGMVLAGGRGNRLAPLTLQRAKPAVPFGGQYRLIDFVLSNLVNAGMRKVVVLTQYLSHSLDRHLASTWRLSPLLGNYVATVPAQMRAGERWFLGSADAIFQNLNILGDERPEHVVVFGADHIYRMDVAQMFDQHIETGAGVTVAGIPVPIGEAGQLGIIEAGEAGRILSFTEKPDEPEPMPDDPERAYASMGNYIFRADVLRDAVTADAENTDSRHDMGGDIIPALVEQGQAWVYNFLDNVVPGQSERERGYWRDVGNLDAYFQASMDLCSIEPTFDLYNRRWPILTGHFPYPPAKFVHEAGARVGRAVNSLVAPGAVVSGGNVRHSILSHEVRVNSFSTVEDTVLFENVEIGRNAVVRGAIIDKNVRVPDGTWIGVDLDVDRERGFTVSEGGVVVVEKNAILD